MYACMNVYLFYNHAVSEDYKTFEWNLESHLGAFSSCYILLVSIIVGSCTVTFTCLNALHLDFVGCNIDFIGIF